MKFIPAKHETCWLHSKGIGWKTKAKEYGSEGHGTKIKGQFKVTPHKAHLLEVTLIPAKYETDCVLSKGITGQKRLCKWKVTIQTSKVKLKVTPPPQKAHLLEVTLIPAKYETD